MRGGKRDRRKERRKERRNSRRKARRKARRNEKRTQTRKETETETETETERNGKKRKHPLIKTPNPAKLTPGWRRKRTRKETETETERNGTRLGPKPYTLIRKCPPRFFPFLFPFLLPCSSPCLRPPSDCAPVRFCFRRRLRLRFRLLPAAGQAPRQQAAGVGGTGRPPRQPLAAAVAVSGKAHASAARRRPQEESRIAAIARESRFSRLSRSLAGDRCSPSANRRPLFAKGTHTQSLRTRRIRRRRGVAPSRLSRSLSAAGPSHPPPSPSTLKP